MDRGIESTASHRWRADCGHFSDRIPRLSAGCGLFCTTNGSFYIVRGLLDARCGTFRATILTISLMRDGELHAFRGPEPTREVEAPIGRAGFLTDADASQLNATLPAASRPEKVSTATVRKAAAVSPWPRAVAAALSYRGSWIIGARSSALRKRPSPAACIR
jgi:hypothetical protein